MKLIIIYDNKVYKKGIGLKSDWGFSCLIEIENGTILFDEEKMPVSGWLFIKAYPVKWSTSDLNAKESSVLIDTMELAYTRMQILRI